MDGMLSLTVVHRAEAGDGTAWSWRDDAACYSTDTESFYPAAGGSGAAAKRVCQRCDVRAECLEYSLQMNDPNGVWGGLGEAERKPLLRARGHAVDDDLDDADDTDDAGEGRDVEADAA